MYFNQNEFLLLATKVLEVLLSKDKNMIKRIQKEHLTKMKQLEEEEKEKYKIWGYYFKFLIIIFIILTIIIWLSVI